MYAINKNTKVALCVRAPVLKGIIYMDTHTYMSIAFSPSPLSLKGHVRAPPKGMNLEDVSISVQTGSYTRV